MSACIDHGLAGDADGYAQRLVGAKKAMLHRLVFASANGMDESTMGGVVMHSCDNTRCINPEHLSLGTHKLNAQDRQAKGRGSKLKGVEVYCAKLTQEAVEYVRMVHVSRHKEFGASALARRFGITPQSMQDVIHGRSYS